MDRGRFLGYIIVVMEVSAVEHYIDRGGIRGLIQGLSLLGPSMESWPRYGLVNEQ